MEDLRCTAVTLGGLTLTLPRPLSLELTRSYDTPADGLEATFPWEGQCSPLVSVRIMLDGNEIFEGLVDEQRLEEGDECCLSLQCRSRAGSWVMDNEALPQYYRNPRLSEMFYNHLNPYGFGRLDCDRNYSMSLFTVEKGLSEWEAFSRFCLCAGGRLPFVREGVVIARPFRQYKTYRLSNDRSPLSLPYLRVEQVLRPSAVVARFILRNDQGVYTSMVTNTTAPLSNVRRKRYLIPLSEYASRPRQDGLQRLAKSNLAYLAYHVDLPGLHPLLPMDTVTLDHPAGRSGLFVAEIQLVISPTGLLTRLTLADPRYL